MQCVVILFIQYSGSRVIHRVSPPMRRDKANALRKALVDLTGADIEIHEVKSFDLEVKE